MNSRQDGHSHLFMVRLWSEAVEDHKGWRGRVQHILSGEARSFRDWSTLVSLFLEMVETERIEAQQPEDQAERRE